VLATKNLAGYIIVFFEKSLLLSVSLQVFKGYYNPKIKYSISVFFVLLISSCFFQVARAGRFGTKGLAITFVSDEGDAKILNDVQDRFEVNITELPDEIDISAYSK